MRIFDSHAHYDDARFRNDADAVLQDMARHGVEHIINVGCSVPSSRKSIALAEKYPFVYASVGIHPHDTDDAVPQDLATLEELLRHPKVKALGEIGLDYHYQPYSRMTQLEYFTAQMELAQRADVPVIIHSREATQDLMDVLHRFPVRKLVCHCFSGSAETAAEIAAMGYHLSFTGVITFSNARRSHEAIRRVPRDRLMIETDCPYMAPEPHRGARCDSRMLKYTLAALAEIWGVSPEEAAEITARNAEEFFEI